MSENRIRLPRKGERYVDLYGNIYFADHDWVAAWLKEHGYDGLCNPDRECGCTLDDLMPCGEPHETECVGGFMGPANQDGDAMIYPSREAAKAARKEQDDD